MRKISRRTLGSLGSAALCLAFVAAPAGGLLLLASAKKTSRRRFRERELPVTMERAEPIIRAIRRYSAKVHRLPGSVDVLVPGYLDTVPNPGPIAEGAWFIEPDETGEGWWLRVNVANRYSPNLYGGFGDTFAFHSTGEYPEQRYGGTLVRHGTWGYYVE